MDIDEDNFTQTAQSVFVMNEYMHGKYDTWKELKNFMISMAYSNCEKTTSFSTGGFQLTSFIGPNGERCVKASVSSYCAQKYLERIGIKF